MEYARPCSRLLLTKAARRMRRNGHYASLLWLWLDLRNGAWFGQRELPAVQDDHACLKALDILWDKARGEIARRSEIVRVGVTLSQLTPSSERQFDLFLNDNKERQRCELLTNTIDRLNQKVGKRVVTLGPWIPPPGGYAGGKIAYNRIPSAEDFW